MQQYVTSGIAGLGLGNRRFSLSRQDSNEAQDRNATGGASGTASGMGVTVAGPSSSGGSGGVVIGNPNANNPMLGEFFHDMSFFVFMFSIIKKQQSHGAYYFLFFCFFFFKVNDS